MDVSKDLLEILKKIREGKIYGSVEVFFEAGEVTQITQRIIKKVKVNKKPEQIQTKNKKSSSDSFNKKPARIQPIVDPVDLPANTY